MILVLDNAESILDPHGANAREICAMAEELSRFSNISLCLTSRIFTVPPACDAFDIPTLSVEAARNAFYCIYKNGRQSDLVDGILEQLAFHPLSINLLATVAYHNKWDVDRLGREWERRRVDVLRTPHDTSLAVTIELSLASPTFQQLGPGARELLGLVAFFPQGIDEKNIDWLFPTIPSRANIFDDFCVLSLTYRSNGFITMLAPLRDYFRPKDPGSSPLLCATKDHYIRRLSVDVDPDGPGFGETRWIMSEDVNVEHLLDVFMSIDANSPGVWDACSNFMAHLQWHKPRLVTLGPKIEGLPDDHPSKPQCLSGLSWLFTMAGNHVEFKRLLILSLEIWRQRQDDFKVAETLGFISRANGLLGHYEEGIQRTREALEIFEQFNHRGGQARSWKELAKLFFKTKQLDAAEEAASKAIDLLDEGDQYGVCGCYRTLGNICHSRGETEKAINHFETALRIASSFSWSDHLFLIHRSLARLFFDENGFDDAHTHIERAKSHASNNPYDMGVAMGIQAGFWYKQGMLEEAKSEALRATNVFEKIGATEGVEHCEALLRDIEEVASRKMDSNGELVETELLSALINFRSQPKALDVVSQDYSGTCVREPLAPHPGRHPIPDHRTPFLLISLTFQSTLLHWLISHDRAAFYLPPSLLVSILCYLPQHIYFVFGLVFVCVP